MKRFAFFVLLALAAAAWSGCDHNDYYDTGLRDEVEELRARVEKLETWCDKANSQIGALQGLVSALEEKDFVTGVTPVVEGNQTVGYTITFTKSGPVTILHGKDGEDGLTPVIGVKKFTDGKYYWTVRIGEEEPVYLLDDAGDKIPATGEKGDTGAQGPTGPTGIPGQTPEISIGVFEGALYWMVGDKWLLHNGAKVPATGPQGDAVFARDGIDTSDPESVTFTLADGVTRITLPRASTVTVGFESYETFIGSAADNEIVLVLPATLKQEDFTAITAIVTGENGVSADVVTRTVAEKWGVKVTKPTFANGSPVAGSARVVLTPPADVRLAETALLRVAITAANGQEHAVTRPVKWFDGVIVRSTAGGLSAAVTDPAVTALAVEGSIDATDFAFIRQNLAALEVLDLSMTDLETMPDRALAFYNAPNTTLRRVVLPDCLATVEKSAFACCRALESIDLRSVATLGRWVFEKCASLREVRLGDRLAVIPNSLFLNCTSLSSIEIPGSVETVGSWVFEGCNALETVILNEGIRNLSQSTFYGSGVVSIRIPTTVTEIPQWAFDNCTRLERITLHDGITTIGDGAFLYCHVLRQFKVPAGVTVLPDNVFEGCAGLQYVEFHDGVSELGERAFANCSSLRSPGGYLSLTFPASLNKLGIEVFIGCEGLTYLNMFDTQVKSLPSGLFSGCTSLVDITLPENLERVAPWAFLQCYSLASVILPATVTELSDHAFHECRKLSMVICKAPTPPTVDATTFDPTYKTSRSLFVPQGADYSAWSDYFDTIFANQ